jgi:hypothetical protein
MTTILNASSSSGLVATADTSAILQLQTASTAAVTIDASQNVGIGASPSYKLDVAGSNVRSRVYDTSTGYGIGQYSNSTGSLFVGKDSAAGTLTGTANAALVYGTGAYPLVMLTNDTERMRIDSSGNVGIGTSSPATKLQVSGTSGSLNARINAGNTGLDITNNDSTGVVNLATTPLGGGGKVMSFTMYNGSSSAEAMRIDSSGTLLVGQTGNPATSSVVIKVATGTGNGVNAQITSNTGTSYPWSNYNVGATYVGGITCTSSATGFATSSDIRLKKNIENASSAIDKVLSAQVVSHDWINDDSHVEFGFVAQDLENIIPQAVIKGTDKEDGSMDIPWGVDYSKIVPLLVKSIQEQQVLITDLTTRLAVLEGAK